MANGSAYQVNGEALDRFGVEVGAGLTADVNDNVEMSIGYEGMFNKILRNGKYASTAAQQGLSLGWADEIEGAAGGLGYGIGSLNKNWNKTGETFGQAFSRGYEKTRDARRANLEEGYQRNPVLTGAAEITGAIGSPAKFIKTNPLASIKNIKRKNLLDAVVGGAVYGAGSTNESKDYAKNIGFGMGGNMTVIAFITE